MWYIQIPITIAVCSKPSCDVNSNAVQLAVNLSDHGQYTLGHRNTLFCKVIFGLGIDTGYPALQRQESCSKAALVTRDCFVPKNMAGHLSPSREQLHCYQYCLCRFPSSINFAIEVMLCETQSID